MSLLQKIKDLRARKASEFPKILHFALQARADVQATTANVVEVRHSSGDYFFREKAERGKKIYTRPIRKNLYIQDDDALRSATDEAFSGVWKDSASFDLERVVYTITQDVGCFLDFFGGNSAKKALGTFFESVIAAAVSRITARSVASGTLNLAEYDAKVSFDLGVYNRDNPELLIASKTSTRERLSQPFVQVAILRGATQKRPRCILIVIGDVQRKEGRGVSHTFTAGQFRLYSRFIAKLDGVFYCDVPPQAASLVKDGLLAPFSKLPAFLSANAGVA
jgi:hypothetical protein